MHHTSICLSRWESVLERRENFVCQVRDNECVPGSSQVRKEGTEFLLQWRHMDIVQSHSSCCSRFTSKESYTKCQVSDTVQTQAAAG